jgi:serine phosphatase RsbU (regulator of sigma subunit)
MKTVLILIIFISTISSYGQDSFQTVKENGKGDVVINYREMDKFIFIENGEFKGLEMELLELFFSWVENKYNVTLNRIYRTAPSFLELYSQVKEGRSGDFGICSFSITVNRLQEVKFSPSYMPDINILVSSKDLPILKKKEDITDGFSAAIALSVAGSTLESDLEKVEEYIPNLQKKYLSTSDSCMYKILNEKNRFAFVELPLYFSWLDKGFEINRQNVFLEKRDGYGVIYPLESDWHSVIWNFFADEDVQIQKKQIIEKYLGKELIEFIEELDNSNVNEQNVLLLSREKDFEKLKAENSELALKTERFKKQKEDQEAASKRIFFTLGVTALVLVLIAVIYAYFQKANANKLILEQKKEVEGQKAIIEDKHKLITDSIHYAKTIQNAMLQGEENESSNLPNHFVFFSPKDVVSGDFYWTKVVGDYYYVASVDCTGHGVPGGFMSVLGISLLNDILFDNSHITPSEICEKLRARVIDELDQTGEPGSSADGMDISLSRINLKSLELFYCGAYNPLYIFRNGDLIELKGNKQPIGYYSFAHSFTNSIIQLEKGDMIYSSTDGYPDQFGGSNDKKLKSSGFKQVLKEAHVLSIEEQKKYLTRFFNGWKGTTEQIDDACVIGMRI